MQEWLYRASTAKAGSAETWDIVKNFGFLHRTAFANSNKALRIPNVMRVAAGDIIHLYFVGESKKGRTLGVLRVVDPKEHPQPALFAASVPETALHLVGNEDLRAKLRSINYEPDPKLDEFCGWPVILEKGMSSPPYAGEKFPGQSSLVERGPA